MEPQFRLFRGADRLCPPEREHQQDLRHFGSGSAPAELLLDPPASDGHDRPAADRQVVRQNLVQDGTQKALSADRSLDFGSRDDLPAERRQPEFLLKADPRTQRRHVVRTVLAHIP